MRVIQIFTAVLTLFIAATSVADNIMLKSGTQKNQLVELFTSEGCSSCPPADAWISKLKKADDLWTDVVPIAFHVDYWDQLGWKDKLARKDFSDRQRRYRQEGLINQVYTPGFVVDGQEWRGFFRRKSLSKLSPQEVGEISAQINTGTVSAEFKPEIVTNKTITFHIAVLGFDISSEIEAGENSGKSLNHDFAVIAYDQVMANKENDTFVANLDLPQSEIEAPKKAVVVWVSEASSQFPVQVVGNWL